MTKTDNIKATDWIAFSRIIYVMLHQVRHGEATVQKASLSATIKKRGKKFLSTGKKQLVIEYTVLKEVGISFEKPRKKK